MSDIFREVDEDLRREQYKRLWDRFGGYVIGLAVLIVVAVGGYKAWEWWENSRAAASGDRFLAALMLSEEGKHEEAIAALGNAVRLGWLYNNEAYSFRDIVQEPTFRDLKSDRRFQRIRAYFANHIARERREAQVALSS